VNQPLRVLAHPNWLPLPFYVNQL